MQMLQQLKKAVGASLRTLVTVVAVLVVVIPAAAWAGHQFTDVPNSNIFHGDIDWMSDNGVTRGCNPPANTEYCPDDFVTREQMSAFMHRLESEGVFAPLHPAMFATATDDTGATHTNTTYANLNGASATVEVPEGHEAVIVARFSAESSCSGGGANAICSVRLLVNGTEMTPTSGPPSLFAFDSSDNADEEFASWESHAMERISATLPSGTYTVTVQVRVSSGTPSFWLDDWALVAEAKLTS